MLNKKRKSPLGDNANSNKEIMISQQKMTLHEPIIAKETVINILPTNIQLATTEVNSNVNTAKYPYYKTIKTIMYAFGDCYNNHHDTVIHIHDFANNFIIQLNQILISCDYKKIIDHFFSYEYEKLQNSKKLKVKNSIITGQSYHTSKNGIESKLCFNDADFGNDDNIFISDDDGSFNLDINSSKRTTNMRKTFEFEEKGDNYTENIVFQSERTEIMSTKQYLEYCSCQQCNFLSLGKKQFGDYLQEIVSPNKCADELVNDVNIELITFILKEELKSIIVEAIKSKHPNRKLFIITNPLAKEDIKQFCQEELNKLSIFLNDFQSNTALRKAFRKKRNLNRKVGNKNVQVKTTDKGLFIVIKKYILIENINEAGKFKTMKLNAEIQALNSFLLLRDKYVVLVKENSKIKSANSKPESDYIKLNFTGLNKDIISIRDLIEYLGIDNYYEYFLVKDYLFEINLKEIKFSEIEQKTKVLRKLRLKTVADKFDTWIKMSKEEQHGIINEFASLVDNKEVLFS